MRKLALMVIVGSSLLLQGCGFHLRGTVTLPEVASNVYVSGNDFDLVTDLKDGLDTNGARINESETAADSSIIIESEFQRKIRTLDNRGIASALPSDTSGSRLPSRSSGLSAVVGPGCLGGGRSEGTRGSRQERATAQGTVGPAPDVAHRARAVPLQQVPATSAASVPFVWWPG